MTHKIVRQRQATKRQRTAHEEHLRILSSREDHVIVWPRDQVFGIGGNTPFPSGYMRKEHRHE